MNNEEVDYRAFARDLLKICRKHGVHITASDALVWIGSEKHTKVGDCQYSAIKVNRDGVLLYDGPAPDILI